MSSNLHEEFINSNLSPIISITSGSKKLKFQIFFHFVIIFGMMIITYGLALGSIYSLLFFAKEFQRASMDTLTIAFALYFLIVFILVLWGEKKRIEMEKRD